ncbi:MAG: DUF1273 family protein [Firmicutes bacterium]|nr:DUF1273 family protein [Bacillota bacterium]
MKNTCCFTGHRAIPFNDRGKIHTLTELYVEFLIKKGVDTFIAGGAVGYDLMCALIVLSMKEKYPGIRLEIILPSPDYGKFFSEKTKRLYGKVFRKADNIIYISNSYTKKSIFLRNMLMADRSSYMVCYCTKQEGGSFFTKSYAQRKKLTIYNVLPQCYD